MKIVRVIVFESDDEEALRRQLAHSIADGERQFGKGIRTLIVTTLNELPISGEVAAAHRAVADTFPPEAPDVEPDPDPTDPA